MDSSEKTIFEDISYENILKLLINKQTLSYKYKSIKSVIEMFLLTFDAMYYNIYII